MRVALPLSSSPQPCRRLPPRACGMCGGAAEWRALVPRLQRQCSPPRATPESERSTSGEDDGADPAIESGGGSMGPSAAGRDQFAEESAGVRAALAVLRFYKRGISPLLQPACRFLPTCSEYAMESYKRYGVSRGTVLTAWRLARCNPWGGRGYDPPA